MTDGTAKQRQIMLDAFDKAVSEGFSRVWIWRINSGMPGVPHLMTVAFSEPEQREVSDG